MDRSVDPHRPIMTMHDLVTVEVTGLMEGFYSNLEDGLFELAYRNADPEYQRYCFELMRELRYRRPLLMSTFTASLKGAVGQLLFLCFELLHAEHVGPLPREPAEETFARSAAQAVGVEGYDTQSNRPVTMGRGMIPTPFRVQFE